jgi:hypothetical protein
MVVSLTFAGGMYYLVQLRDVPASPCVGCSLQASRILSIGGIDSPVGFKPAAVVRDLRGRYIILPTLDDLFSSSDSVIPVFDSTGRLVRYLARRGTGPGELGALSSLPIDIDSASEDSISVFTATREYVYDARTLAFVRQRNLPQRIDLETNVLRLKNGSIASVPFVFDTVRINSRTGDTVRTTVTLRDSTGRMLRTPISVATTSESSRTKRGALSSLRDGFLVATTIYANGVPEKGYRVGFFSSVGALMGVFRRLVPSWSALQPVARSNAPGILRRPATSIAAVRQSSDTLVWVALAHPDLSWSNVTLDGQYSLGNYSTIVDVVEPVRPTLVGSVILRGAPVSFASDGVLATYHQDSLGVPFVEVWRLSLVRP